MDYLVESIQKIGIFMLAAQAVIHFAPDQKYEKYIRVIVSLVLLLQIILPFYKVFHAGEALEVEKQLLEMEQIDEAEALLAWDGTAQEDELLQKQIVESMEGEIKSKLNNYINNNLQEENLREKRITDVTITIKENKTEWELTKVLLTVQSDSTIQKQEKMGSFCDAAEPIEIEKITVSQNPITDNAEMEDEIADSTKEAEKLREDFSKVLGISKEKVEVMIARALNDSDKGD